VQSMGETMDSDDIFNHIVGGIAGALIGDAMGAATEGMTPEKIKAQFGGRVVTFFAPPEGTFAAGRKPGELTDDSTQMLEMLQAEIETRGQLTPQAVADHLLKWAQNEVLFGRFAGPSTRKALKLLMEGKSPTETGFPTTPLDMISNGAAMKVSPIGLAHPGNPDAAIRDAITMCIPTHNTDVAYAGAAAVAAAVSIAVIPQATFLAVVDAALYGAKEGYRIGKAQAQIIPSPSVVERIRLAIEIASAESEFDVACLRLGNVIGCGLPIIEAVPVAIGLFLASRGDPNSAIFGAVNLGGDADTVATITGAIAGAYAGIDRFQPNLVGQIEAVNHIQLAGIARQLMDLVSAQD